MLFSFSNTVADFGIRRVIGSNRQNLQPLTPGRDPSEPYRLARHTFAHEILAPCFLRYIVTAGSTSIHSKKSIAIDKRLF
jgi:hypothetical protein